MKINKRILFILLTICIIISCIFILKPYYTFKLNGDETIIINQYDTYKEKGTNQDEATITGSVDTSKLGNYTLTYTYHSKVLKRTVKVVDPNRILFAYKGSEYTIVKKNDPYIESGCDVFDLKDGFLNDQVKTTGSVDTSKTGTYTITYKVTNSAGYTLRKKRQVEVVDDTKYSWAESFPVLMYHWVYTKDSNISNLNNNFILDTTLETQLQYLKDENYYFPSYAELAAYLKGKISLPKKSVIVSFDDGAKRFLINGTPIINKLQIPVTSFLIGVQDGDDKVKNYFSPYITFQSHSYNMHRGGGSIGHGGVISSLTKQEIEDDLTTSINQVGVNDAFAYPFGDVTDTAKEAVKDKGFLVAFTTENRKCVVGDDLYALPRVRINGGYTFDKFKEVLEE